MFVEIEGFPTSRLVQAKSHMREGEGIRIAPYLQVASKEERIASLSLHLDDSPSLDPNLHGMIHVAIHGQ
jgi:hypothetical protein